MTRQEREEYLKLLIEKDKRSKRSHLLRFTEATMPTFSPNWFHKSYYEVLNKFANGDIKKLMVFVPPQHGKSEGSTRRLPAFLVGKTPTKRIAIASYSSAKARKFNREIQRIIDDSTYKSIFPEISLSNGSDGYSRTMDEIEIIHKDRAQDTGSIKTVGVGGALTGEPVDILILDDIYKDAASAWSETVRDNIQDWYNTVADSRLHNDSQVLIVFTRWHEKDLAGYLLNVEPDDWEVFTYPAIKIGEPNDYDPRKEGEALWAERHNVEKLEAIQNRDKHVFESLYQGNPKAREGLLYETFKTYKTLPSDAIRKRAVIDTADTGDDYLCCIIYSPTITGYYIIDVYYTNEKMEVTEDGTARILSKHSVNDVMIESNNGGRGFARNVERLCRVMGNTKTSFTWQHQSTNKETRIFTHAADVQNMVYYPDSWDSKHHKFYSAVTGFMAKGKNKNDDAPDALTMIIENETRKALKAFAR
jgi:predicted phage terminase large subunit-like protein